MNYQSDSPPMPPVPYRKAHKPRPVAQCPVCGRWFAVKKDGSFYPHATKQTCTGKNV